MLARNFKTADELSITDIEHQSLITVLGMMERGEIKDFEPFTYQKEGERGNPQNYLYLPTFFGPAHECGTTACIAGWCHLVSDGKAFPELKLEREMELNLRKRSRAMGNFIRRVSHEAQLLFKLDSNIYSSTNPPVSEVADALRNYLTTGHPVVK
jgi:hypothetical protein